LILGQRAIFALGARVRSRLNRIYMATFFAGGAVGSALGGWAYPQGAWSLSFWVGFGLPMPALACFLVKR
jgi:predicted MFS family arabinose efflux permease